MRLAISNIAWDISNDADAVALLRKFNVDAIDVAPGKYFPDLANATLGHIEEIRHWWSDRGIEITGMQALLFGSTGLNVFGSQEEQNSLLQHMAEICRIGAGLGATRLVFGSPRNRDRSGLSDEQARAVAVPFFRRLGDLAFKHGVTICLEPNPTCYGANFMTTSAETANVVTSINHPAIRMQLDTGALTINGESIETVLSENAHLIGHVHISEPNLVPLGDVGTDHGGLHKAMAQHIPNHVASVEMVATKNEPQLVAVERALSCATRYYGATGGAPA